MSGFVLWEGMSRLVERSPIVVIVTQNSVNRKTGDMDQAWILRSDMHPLEAVRSLNDDAICGDCEHRGATVDRRSCYVTVQHGPAAVYRAFKAGKYPRVDPRSKRFVELAGSRFLRMGAYGDPAAAPFFVWRRALLVYPGWTGYTSQWRTCDQAFATMLMASTKSQEETREANQKGWRTFRTRHGGSVGLMHREMICPASEEAGHMLTCAQCKACNGHASRQRKNVTIYAHGTYAANFYRNAQFALFQSTTTGDEQ